MLQPPTARPALDDTAAGHAAPLHRAVLNRLLDEAALTHQRREQLLAQLAETLVQLDALEADLRRDLPTDSAPLRRLGTSRSALAGLAQQVAADTREDHARQDEALARACRSLADLPRT
jgi:hypothetical protein